MVRYGEGWNGGVAMVVRVRWRFTYHGPFAVEVFGSLVRWSSHDCDV